jgi:hypothetical protein
MAMRIAIIDGYPDAVGHHLLNAMADAYAAACRMGLEGLVSKRRDRPYQARSIKTLDQGQEPAASGDPG